jgi:hypothetical protein
MGDSNGRSCYGGATSRPTKHESERFISHRISHPKTALLPKKEKTCQSSVSFRRQQLCTHLAMLGTNNCTGQQCHDKKNGSTSKKWYVCCKQHVMVSMSIPSCIRWNPSGKPGRPLRIKKRHTTSTCHMHVAAKRQKQKSIDKLFAL